jgi:cytochrome P450
MVKDKSDLLSLYLDKDSFKDFDKGEDDTFIEASDKNMRDVILNMVIAGRDTTAQALSWAFFRLCTHPEIQQKTREEVMEVLKTCDHENENGETTGQKELEALLSGGGKGKIGFKAVQQMKYVECVCMEALRLHPSVPKEGKCCFKDEVLPDGTPVRKGDLISFFPWIMGRDTDLWGPDAGEFKPERFLENMKPSPFVFTAFQAGPRTCLGQNFAMLEMKTVLARLLLKYEFKLGQDVNTVTYENSLTLPIKGNY